MAAFVHPDSGPAADFCGVGEIFEYTNDDGTLPVTNCGQAAAATFLTFYGKLAPPGDLARRVMEAIERAHPPDNLGGVFGSSRRRVIRICKAHGVRVEPITGEEQLRACLARRRPVMVMLRVSQGTFWKFDLPGGHWMVAYGFDRDHVYLTNWGKMTWAEFRWGWDSIIPQLLGMRNRGLALETPQEEQHNDLHLSNKET